MSNSGFVKRSLSGHAWLGLFSGAFMYLICLSGALAVFYQEFERWEQPNVDEIEIEVEEYDVQLIEAAYLDFTAQHVEETTHHYIVFPRAEIPRVVIENDHLARFMNEDGSLGIVENPAWSKMLAGLHMHLHLPGTFGAILVSIFGALLFSLIISGLLSHPRIFKDAFRFRWGGNKRLEQADIHNRLSVWGIPFHLMISLTGAYFGLATLVVVVAAGAFYEGDREAVFEAVFSKEPALIQDVAPAKISVAMESLATIAPGSTPIFMTIHEPETPQQFMEILVQQDGRLIYSENYRFDSAGNYIGKAGFSDGALGKQIVYSTYRLHFGTFGGFGIKVIYFVLGLSLTIISAAGINIWLAKRSNRDYINDLWVAFVWGAPLAFVVSAIAQLFLNIDATLIFWLSFVLMGGYSCWQRNENKVKVWLQRSTATMLIVLVAGYCLLFFEDALREAALGVNCTLLAVAVVLFYMAGKVQGVRHKKEGEELRCGAVSD